MSRTKLEQVTIEKIGTSDQLKYFKMKGQSMLVEDRAFENITNLIELDLSSNSELNLFGGSFIGLFKLRSLNLENNNIEIVEKNWFHDLIALELLNIAQNEIMELGGEVFKYIKNLRVLRLMGNKLEKLDQEIFTGVTKLEVMYLQFNRLSDIKPGTFSNLKNLRELCLIANSCINEQFVNSSIAMVDSKLENCTEASSLILPIQQEQIQKTPY